MSLGSPTRPSGVRSVHRCSQSPSPSSGVVIADRTAPGATALTRILRGPYSRAADCVRAATAAFAAAYGPSPGEGRTPLTQAVLTMLPPAAASRWGPADRL